MTVDSISTYATFQSTLNDLTKVQNDLANAQGQLSSGNKSQDFAGMASQTQQYLGLNASLNRIGQYANDNQVIENRINTTASALGNVVTIATTLQNLIIQRRNITSNTGAFATQIREQWQSLVGQLNINVDGQFLFSGTRTNVPAVDSEDFPTLVTPGVPDDSYYQGSDHDIDVRVDDNVIITYNVRANDPGLQKLFAGLATAMTGHTNGSDDELSDAEDLVQAGLKDIIAAQATVNANKVAISTINQNHQTLKLYWQGLKESIGNADIVAVSTQVAVNQGILQSSFAAFAKITSLRLVDFLR